MCCSFLKTPIIFFYYRICLIGYWVKNNQVTSDGKVKVSVNIPERLLIELDAYRNESNQDRSIWITSAIMEKLASIKLGKSKINKDI